MGCLARNLNHSATAISSSQTYFRLTSFHSRSIFNSREIEQRTAGFSRFHPSYALSSGVAVRTARAPIGLGTASPITRVAYGLLYPSGRTLRVARVHRR